jgi:hypothetical protein
MEKYKLQIGIGLGTVIGGLLGWWHGFAGWPVWAAIPFLVGLGALIGYRSINQDRRGLVWLILWMLPGALFGLLAGVIGKAEPVGIIHLALCRHHRSAWSWEWACRYHDWWAVGGWSGIGAKPDR